MNLLKLNFLVKMYHLLYSNVYPTLRFIIVKGLTSPLKYFIPSLLIAILVRLTLFKQYHLYPIDVLLSLTLVIEVLFYYHIQQVYSSMNLRRPGNNLSFLRRKLLIRKVLNEIHHQDKLSIFSEWFALNEKKTLPLSVIKHWFSWALFNKEIYDLNKGETSQLNTFVEYVRKKTKNEIEKVDLVNENGLSENEIQCIKISLTDILYEHKPFIFYLGVAFIQSVGKTILKHFGFKRYSTKSRKLNYWLYQPKKNSNNEQPILFLHGVGIGITTYISLMYGLMKRYPNRSLLFIEMPHISLTPTYHVLSAQEFILELDQIFISNQIDSTSLIAHSYGTIFASWIMKYRPKYCLTTTLIDPVCFQMWESTLVKNFLVGEPQCILSDLCRYFIARDLFVANGIYRHFNWTENILFLDKKIKDKKCRIFLSEFDWIINSKLLNDYFDVSKEKHQLENCELYMMKGLTHGQFLFDNSHMSQVIKGI